MKGLLSVLIVHYNTPELLRQCLASLTAAEGDFSFEIIVIDNASPDVSVKSLVEEFGQGEGERRSMDVQAIRDGKPEVFRDAIYTHLEAGDVFLWVSHKQLAHSRMRSP